MKKTWCVPVFAVHVLCIGNAWAGCRVLDPELQASYAGGCVNGLAEGIGSAAGSAEYRGAFRAGRKHGQGEKRWPNGDRYVGAFVEDRKEGRGLYEFGRGAWAGERYEGGFANDRRHGLGEYRWSSGDVYRGPWRDGVATGEPTAMMRARARFEREALAALAPGAKACREQPVGIGRSEWIRGEVTRIDAARVTVRVGGEAITSPASEWTPCW